MTDTEESFTRAAEWWGLFWGWIDVFASITCAIIGVVALIEGAYSKAAAWLAFSAFWELRVLSRRLVAARAVTESTHLMVRGAIGLLAESQRENSDA